MALKIGVDSGKVLPTSDSEVSMDHGTRVNTKSCSPLTQLPVAIDVGCTRRRVAVGLSEGTLLDEFDVTPDGPGLTAFFKRNRKNLDTT